MCPVAQSGFADGRLVLYSVPYAWATWLQVEVKKCPTWMVNKVCKLCQTETKRDYRSELTVIVIVKRREGRVGDSGPGLILTQ